MRCDLMLMCWIPMWFGSSICLCKVLQSQERERGREACFVHLHMHLHTSIPLHGCIALQYLDGSFASFILKAPGWQHPRFALRWTVSMVLLTIKERPLQIPAEGLSNSPARDKEHACQCTDLSKLTAGQMPNSFESIITLTEI